MLHSAIATVSLGRSSAGHGIIEKIKHAKRAGFAGVEIFFECLELFACELSNVQAPASREALVAAARRVHEACEAEKITVVCLQPFLFFEGLVDEKAREEKFQLLKLWFELAHALNTDIIQIPSNFQADGTTGNLDRITSDLTEAARLGLEQSPPIRFAYEGISWGTHIDTWEQTWEIVKRVNLPNFGLCLDVFHIAGRTWADPAAASGTTPNADQALESSLRKLAAEVDPKRVFYVQIGDAERMQKPIAPGNALYEENVKPRMSWSRNARLFPFEESLGGYLPVWRVCRTIFVELGWVGWTSMEMFNRSLYDTDGELPRVVAARAGASWTKFSSRLESVPKDADL